MTSQSSSTSPPPPKNNNKPKAPPLPKSIPVTKPAAKPARKPQAGEEDIYALEEEMRGRSRERRQLRGSDE